MTAVASEPPAIQAPESFSGRGSGADRIRELDAVRGLAVIAVMLYHYTTRFQELYGHPAALRWSVPWGHYGVEVFFIISGMVIFFTIERTSSVRRFVWARFARLYPVYWVALILIFAVVKAVGLPGREVSNQAFFWNLTMGHAFAGWPDVDGAHWSLHVELAFYGLAALILGTGAIRRLGPVLLAWLAGLALLPIVPRVPGLIVEILTLFGYGDLFVLGIVFHLRRTRGACAATTAAGCAAIALHAYRQPIASTVVICAAAVLFELIVRGVARWLIARPLLFLGAISYPLYLVHQNIGYVVLRMLYRFGTSPSVAISIAVVIAMTLASVLHWYVEDPALAWLKQHRRTAPMHVPTNSPAAIRI